MITQAYKRTKASDPHIFIVGFYPHPECDDPVRKQRFECHYWSLMHTYGVSLQLVDSVDEVMLGGDHPIVVVEEERDGVESVELIRFTHPKNAMYIVGNSEYRWPSDHFDADFRVHVKTPKPDHPLYGDQVLAIVLNDQENKQ